MLNATNIMLQVDAKIMDFLILLACKTLDTGQKTHKNRNTCITLRIETGRVGQVESTYIIKNRECAAKLDVSQVL